MGRKIKNFINQLKDKHWKLGFIQGTCGTLNISEIRDILQKKGVMIFASPTKISRLDEGVVKDLCKYDAGKDSIPLLPKQPKETIDAIADLLGYKSAIDS